MGTFGKVGTTRGSGDNLIVAAVKAKEVAELSVLSRGADGKCIFGSAATGTPTAGGSIRSQISFGSVANLSSYDLVEDPTPGYGSGR